MDELEARFRGTITPAASEDATTSTYVISDAPSVLNGCKIESEREVSKDGASLGTAQTRQYGYSSRVRYCAYLQSDSGEKFRFRLYGSAEEGSAFKVFGARLYTTGGKVYIPAESVSVEASAFVPEQEPDDSDDDE